MGSDDVFYELRQIVSNVDVDFDDMVVVVTCEPAFRNEVYTLLDEYCQLLPFDASVDLATDSTVIVSTNSEDFLFELFEQL